MGWDVLGKAFGIDMGIQLVAGAIGWLLKTERFYDITGSLTFLTLGVYTMFKSPTPMTDRKMANNALLFIWAIRLGSFLAIRILRDKKDRRFDRMKKDIRMWFIVWAMQGLWVFLTALPVYLLNNSTNQEDPPINWRDYLGWAMWTVGWLTETVADWQKFTFRADPANHDKFISSGLWRYSRHPNYFGEMTLWWGMYLSCSSTLRAWEHVGVIGPVFLTYLLTQVSGIPLLERASDKTWKGVKEYEDYKQRTSILIPLPPSSKKA